MIFWESIVLINGIPILLGNAPLLGKLLNVVFILLGLIFVCIGIYLLLGRFFYAVREAENTSYFITNKRVVIKRKEFIFKYSEVSLQAAIQIYQKKKRSDTGSIYFRTSDPISVIYIAGWPGLNHLSPVFRTIKQSNEVFRIAQDAQEQSKSFE